MATELAVMPTNSQLELAAAFMPVMAMPQAIQRYNAVLDFTKQIMKEGKDFGTIPGVDKPSLFKPGAEKLCNFFGLTPKFVVVKETEHWDGDEPFFYYWYKCQLWRGSILIAEGDGSCNSRESKYRYRWVSADQVPSHLNREKLPFRAGKATEPKFAIEKGETGGKYGKPAEYWQSFREAIANKTAIAGSKESKTSGRPMKTWSIESTVYRIPNPEISDVVNTIQKMAQKRSLVAVTLIGCNASEYFTQDIEDMQSIDVPYHTVVGEAAHGPRPAAAQQQHNGASASQPHPEPQPPDQGQEKAQPSAQQPPQEQYVEQSKLDMILAKFTRLQAIADFFAELRPRFCDVLDVTIWQRVCDKYGVDDQQKKFGTFGNAKKCFTELWGLYQEQSAKIDAIPVEEEPPQ